MANRVVAYGRFTRTLVSMNLRAALEYRVSFIVGVIFMALNDGMWIVFWGLFFHQFPVVRGWELSDIVTMWAVAATGFGIATGIFGNCRAEGARVIVEGRLDYHLSVPKSPLLHYLLGSISVMAWGDVLFGFVAFIAVVQPGPGQMALFLLLSATAAVMFISFGVLVNAIAFWAGNSEGFGMQMTNALITFSTYPLDLFSLTVKVLLFVALPAGFLSYLPVQMLREFSLAYLLAVEGFAVGLALLATWVFYRGLRRYESGSLVIMRS
jgi:ABC-2 type transport system permease protein